MRTLLELSLNDYSKQQAKDEQRLSYFNIVGETPLLGLTLGQLIDNAARKYGEREGLVVPFQNIRKTFTQLKSEIDDLARGFLAIGLQKGDRLALWSLNTYEYYLTQMAAWKSGLILVCINAAYQSRELLHCLNKVGVKAIVFSKQFRTQNFYDILVRSIPEIISSQPGKLTSKQAPELEIVISVEPNCRGTFSFEQIMNFGSNNILANSLEELNIEFDDISTLFFTSGTTGSPKAAMISHHSLVNNGFFVGKRLGISEKDKICLPVPLFHVYGCQIGAIASIHYGAALVLPSYGYDANAIVQVSKSEDCTILVGTPTMFSDVLKAVDQYDYQVVTLKKAVTGGAVCSEKLIKDMKLKLSTQFVSNNYGMTEIGSAYQSISTDSDHVTCSSVGFPGEHIEVKLVSKQGNIVPIGHEGELCVRGYSVMHGYWGEPEKTLDVLEPSRWFHTGDLFVMHETCHAQVVGRIKEMINRGGENVYPREVEDFLKTHPKIEEAQVFGVPDYRMGEEPAVWIRLKQDEFLTQDEIKSFCKGQISHFKIPKYIIFKEDFPRTPLGKVQKFRMREETMKLLKLTVI